MTPIESDPYAHLTTPAEACDRLAEQFHQRAKAARKRAVAADREAVCWETAEQICRLDALRYRSSAEAVTGVPTATIGPPEQPETTPWERVLRSATNQAAAAATAHL